MFRISYAASAAALVLALTACSSNEPPRGGGGPGGARGGGGQMMMPRVVAQPLGLLFAGMDANGDAETSRAEVEIAVPKIFASTDTDENGLLRPIEFQAFAIRYLGTNDTALATRSFDRNLNGEVTEFEFTGYLMTMFDRADKNRDGILQRSEFVETIEPQGMRGGGGGGPGGQTRGGRGGGGRR
ncbi:MAG: hypothetical protein AAF830_00425 [Pseudomonadota bacterium]